MEWYQISKLTLGFEDVCLHTVHELGFDDLLTHLFTRADEVPHDACAAVDDVQVRVGQQIEEAVRPLGALEHLLAALLTLRCEHGECAGGRPYHLRVLVIAAEEDAVLDLVVLALAPLYVDG